jgi:hypothetical protein
MKRNMIQEAIGKIFDAEVAISAKYRRMPEGHIEEYRGKFIEYMIAEIANTFIFTKNIDKRLSIARFLADYGGYRPVNQVERVAGENPYEGMDEKQLKEVQRRMLNDISGEAMGDEEGEAGVGEEESV